MSMSGEIGVVYNKCGLFGHASMATVDGDNETRKNQIIIMFSLTALS